MNWERRFNLPGENGRQPETGGAFGAQNGGAEGAPPNRPPVRNPEGSRYPVPPVPPRRPEVSRIEASTGGDDNRPDADRNESIPPHREYPAPSPEPPPVPAEPGSAASRGEHLPRRDAPNFGDAKHANESSTPIPDPREGGTDVNDSGFTWGDRSEAGHMDSTDPIAPDAQGGFDSAQPVPAINTEKRDTSGDARGENRDSSEHSRGGPDYGGPDYGEGGHTKPSDSEAAPNIAASTVRGVADFYVRHTWPVPEDEHQANIAHRNAVRASANQPRYIASRTKTLAGAPVAAAGSFIATGAIPAEATGWGLIAAGGVAALKKVGGRRHFKAGAVMAGSGGALEVMAATGEPKLAGAVLAITAGGVALKGIQEGVTRAVRWQRSEGVVSRELRRQSRLRRAVTNHTRGLENSREILETTTNPLRSKWHEMRVGMHQRALDRRQQRPE